MENKQRKTIKFEGEEIFIEVSQYDVNDRIALLAYTNKESYSNITINLPKINIKNDEGFITPIAKNCGIEEKLIKEKIIKKINKTIMYNMEKYDLVKFDLEELRKYDSKGIEKFNLMLKEKEYNYEM